MALFTAAAVMGPSDLLWRLMRPTGVRILQAVEKRTSESLLYS